jgi:hypothetical protein
VKNVVLWGDLVKVELIVSMHMLEELTKSAANAPFLRALYTGLRNVRKLVPVCTASDPNSIYVLEISPHNPLSKTTPVPGVM